MVYILVLNEGGITYYIIQNIVIVKSHDQTITTQYQIHKNSLLRIEVIGIILVTITRKRACQHGWNIFDTKVKIVTTQISQTTIDCIDHTTY